MRVHQGQFDKIPSWHQPWRALLSMLETMSDADGNKCTGHDMNLLSCNKSTMRRIPHPLDFATQNPGAVHGVGPSTLAIICFASSSSTIESAATCQCLGVHLAVNTLYSIAPSFNWIFIKSPLIGLCGSVSHITSLNLSHILSFIDIKRKPFLVLFLRSQIW